MTTDVIYLPAFTREEGIEKSTALFREIFGEEPVGVWEAPGRVNLIGEHVDYNGGLCLPTALPHRAYVAVKPREDRLVRLVSPQTKESVDEFDLDVVGPKGSAGEVKGWAAYLVGVAWALEQAGYGPLKGFDVALYSCVPLGGGLSSSAALECAMAVALDDLNGLGLAGPADAQNDEGRKVLVDASRAAENKVAGANTGGLDQSASMRGQEGMALELDTRDMSVKPIPFDLASHGMDLLVIDTKAPHQLVDGQYAARRQNCEDAAKILGVDLLVEIEADQLDDALAKLDDEVLKKRVRHVVTEIARTRECVRILKENEMSEEVARQVGLLFDGSHASLRDDYEVTVPELDIAVETAKKAGAYGARMTGGGFGGSAIALIPAEKAMEVASAITEAFEAHQFNQPEFLQAPPSGPAQRSK